MNIVSMAMKYVGPVVIDRIARSLGINSTLARTAVATALPAILAALSGKGASGGGAGAILDAVRNKGAGTLQNLEGMFGGPDEARHVEEGRRELDSVLGGGEMGPIMQAVSRFTGVEEDKSRDLFGMMGPVALGALGEEVSKQGMDASGLSHFLSAQQRNIADALPNGFADHVSGSSTFAAFRSGLMSADTAPAGTTAYADPVDRPVTQPHADYAEPARGDYDEPKRSGGMLWPLVGLLALLAVGWWLYNTYFAGRTVEAPAGIEQSLGDADFSGQITGAVENVRESLESITDVESARAALPDLTIASENLERVQGLAANLPEAQRGAVSGMVGTALETLEPMLERVRGIPGVGDVVGPVLDNIVEALRNMAG